MMSSAPDQLTPAHFTEDDFARVRSKCARLRAVDTASLLLRTGELIEFNTRVAKLISLLNLRDEATGCVRCGFVCLGFCRHPRWLIRVFHTPLDRSPELRRRVEFLI